MADCMSNGKIETTMLERIAKRKIADLVSHTPFPLDIMIEVTNACNHKCVFCPSNKAKRKRGYIEHNLCARILVEAHNEGAREAGLYTTGEPLLHEDLPYLVRTAKDIGYDYIYISTNGSLLTEKLADELIEAGLDSIKFSINASTRETYWKIHRKSHFDRVIANFDAIKGIKKMVTFVVTDDNRHEQASAKKNIQADELLFVPERTSVKMPCTMLFNRFHVTWEGYYTMCCIDFENELVVADLNKVSIGDAWVSDKAVALREAHLRGDIVGTPCAKCL